MNPRAIHHRECGELARDRRHGRPSTHYRVLIGFRYGTTNAIAAEIESYRQRHVAPILVSVHP